MWSKQSKEILHNSAPTVGEGLDPPLAFFVKGFGPFENQDMIFPIFYSVISGFGRVKTLPYNIIKKNYE